MSKRETNRYQIHSFYSNYPSNHFDSIVRKMTEQIIEEKNELSQKREVDIKKHFVTEMQIYLLEKELFAMSKMRVIYMYMQFEIHLKKLISVAYDEKEQSLYNWDKVISFFKSKDIDIKILNNYSDVKDILELNNSIKHSEGLINNRTKNIIEFKGRKSANTRVLNDFYERTMESPKELIRELAKEIDKDLYEFSDSRLEAMINDLDARMDEKTKEKFITRLKKN